jgi:4-diphosphocytidyl-2-C-methyl-D-erythritol kinase
MLLHAEAPGKINRELRVGALRPDGYHEVLSRIVSIDLADHLEVAPSGELEFSCTGARLPVDDSNLVIRAARALARHLRIAPRARIRLEKHVPVGAGLGGGSADAAVTLLLLARLWEFSGSLEELSEIAAGLGADVPFFLVGGEADVSGRGEQVLPREDSPEQELLLLVPPFSLATRQVYAAFDRLQGARPNLPQRLSLETSREFFGPNDLYEAARQTEPRMSRYLDSASQASTEFAITGSGSSIVMRGTDSQARGWLERRHPEATLQAARTLGRQDYWRRTSGPGGSPWKSLR